MISSKIHIGDNDRVIVKHLYKYPVPTAHEVKLLLDSLPDYSAAKIGLALMAIQGLRPVEVPRLTWSNFWWNEDKTAIEKMRHLVYKPTNRATLAGNNFYFKEVEKPFYSNWLSRQIIGYAKITAPQNGNRVFPFRCSDSLQKVFTVLRKKAKEKRADECWLDSCSETLIGQNLSRYRINQYSLRRFAFSFHYHMTFTRNVLALSKMFGHTRPDTTLQYYVMPAAAIGLTEAMIEEKIGIDEFIHLHGKKQMQLDPFIEAAEPRFLPSGQRTISDFQ